MHLPPDSPATAGAPGGAGVPAPPRPHRMAAGPKRPPQHGIPLPPGKRPPPSGAAFPIVWLGRSGSLPGRGLQLPRPQGSCPHSIAPSLRPSFLSNQRPLAPDGEGPREPRPQGGKQGYRVCSWRRARRREGLGPKLLCPEPPGAETFWAVRRLRCAPTGPGAGLGSGFCFSALPRTILSTRRAPGALGSRDVCPSGSLPRPAQGTSGLSQVVLCWPGSDFRKGPPP